MYQQNNTEDFMVLLDTPEEGAFLQNKWHAVDKSQLEKFRKADLLDNTIVTVQEKHDKDRVCAVKKGGTEAHLQAVGHELVLEENEVKKMTVAVIQLQLQFLRSLNEDANIARAKDTKKQRICNGSVDCSDDSIPQTTP